VSADFDADDRDALANDRAYAEVKSGDVRCTYARPCGTCESCNPQPWTCDHCGFSVCRCRDLFSEAALLMAGVIVEERS